MKKVKRSFLNKSELEAKMRERITSFVTSVKSARAEKESQWDIFYRMWKAKGLDSKDSDYSGRAKTFSPMGHQAIEVFASRVPELIFEREDPVQVVPSHDQTPETILLGQVNTTCLVKQFQKNKQRLKFSQFFRNCARDGSAVAAVTWRYETREIISSEQVPEVQYDVDGNPLPEPVMVTQEVRKEIDTFDAPDLRNINLKNFYIDPTVKSIDEAPFVVEETPATYNQLLRLAKNGVLNEKRVRELKGLQPTSNEFLDGTHDERFDTVGFSSTDFGEAAQPFRVFEYWGLFEVEDELEIEVVATMAEDKLLRFEANPYWHQKKPYIFSPYIPDDMSVYGIGMLEPVYREILMSNTIKNQSIDRVTQDLCNMWLRSRASNIKNEQLKFRPNGVIDTNSMEGLAALRPNGSSIGQGMEMLEFLGNSVQKTTGATDMLSGTQETGSRTTAFALKSNLNQATVKLKAIIDTIVDSAVKPYWHMCQALNSQYRTQKDTIDLVGKDGERIPITMHPEDVMQEFDIEIYSADDLISDNYQVQNIMSYLNWQQTLIPMLQEISRSTGQPVQIPDVNALGDRVWKKIGFKEPVPKITLAPPPPPPPEKPAPPKTGINFSVKMETLPPQMQAYIISSSGLVPQGEEQGQAQGPEPNQDQMPPGGMNGA